MLHPTRLAKPGGVAWIDVVSSRQGMTLPRPGKTGAG